MTMVNPTKCLTRKLHQSYTKFCSNGKEERLPNSFYEANVNLRLILGDCVLRKEHDRPVFFINTDVNIKNKIQEMGLHLNHFEVVPGIIYVWEFTEKKCVCTRLLE